MPIHACAPLKRSDKASSTGMMPVSCHVCQGTIKVSKLIAETVSVHYCEACEARRCSFCGLRGKLKRGGGVKLCCESCHPFLTEVATLIHA